MSQDSLSKKAMHHIICEGGLEGWTRQQNLVQLDKRPDEPEHRAIMQHTVIKQGTMPQGSERLGSLTTLGASLRMWRELSSALLHYEKRSCASCVTALFVGLEVCQGAWHVSSSQWLKRKLKIRISDNESVLANAVAGHDYECDKRLAFAFTPGQCLADGVQQRPQENHDGGLRTLRGTALSYTRKPKM